MRPNSAKWIWYRNDFELWTYHNLSKRRRQRKDVVYPTWSMDRPEYQVVFLGNYSVPEDTEFKVYHSGVITVCVDGNPWFEDNPDGFIPLKKGEGTIRIYCMTELGVPSIFIDSKYVKTDQTWQAYCVDNVMVDASCSEMFTKSNYGPNDYKLPTKKLLHKSVKKVGDGALYDFGRELVGFPVIKTKTDKKVQVFYGESEIEALDWENSEVCDTFDCKKNQTFIGSENRGFRYVYIKNTKNVEEFYLLEEVYIAQFKPLFKSDDKRLNDIYSTAKYTLELTSREFFIDGIKRDRWVWAGDVLQSIWFDLYTFFDTDIIKRTLLALAGKQEIRSNMSGILDYNFYYILSVYFYYKFTGDKEFISKIYPRLESLMRFIISKPRKDGFIMAKNEWIFIDWTDIKNFATINNTYPVSLIQILFYKSLETMIEFEKALSLPENPVYKQEIAGLKERINQVFFDEKYGFYHDTAHTLKTKYGNIFAILTGFASPEQVKIISKAINNPEFSEIYTPYMKFYELCAIAECGDLEYVLSYMDYYWGGMLDHGATTFWERFNPEQTGNEKYAMYGRKYGKSLCHSWGAGPLYLIGKYLVGIAPLEDGYLEYRIKPYLGKVKYKSKLPVLDTEVSVEYTGDKLKIFSPNKDGVLSLNENLDCTGLEFSEEKQGYILKRNTEYVLNVKEER